MTDDEAVVAAAVRADGTELSSAGRDAARARFESAVRGDLPVLDEPVRQWGRHWLVAAAAVVVVGGTVAVLATNGDDHEVRPATGSTSSLQEATTVESTPSISVVDSTVALPSTSVQPVPTTAPLPALGGEPYASVDAQLPVLVAGAPVQVGAAGETPAWSMPWPFVSFPSSVQRTPQGWLAGYRSGASGPWTVRFFDATGARSWQISVAASKADGTTWNQLVEPGPRNVVYVRYSSDTAASLDAIATAGPKAGTVLASWPLDPAVQECGFPCVIDTAGGHRVQGGTIVPFVDESGAPISDANPYFGSPFGYSYAPGPAMPPTWVTSSALSGDLESLRTTVTQGATTWTFDALGVLTNAGSNEGYPFFTWMVAPDGGYVLTVQVGDHADPSAGRHDTDVVVLHHDGTVSIYRLDPALGQGPVWVDPSGDLVIGRDLDPVVYAYKTWVRLQPQG